MSCLKQGNLEFNQEAKSTNNCDGFTGTSGDLSHQVNSIGLIKKFPK